MSGHRFPSVFGNHISLSFCPGLCVCWGEPSVLSHAVCNPALVFTSCVCRVWISQGWGWKVFSGLSWTHVVLFLRLWLSRLSEYIGNFPSSYAPRVIFPSVSSMLFIFQNFRKVFYLSNLHLQHGVPTHDPKIKSHSFSDSTSQSLPPPRHAF